MEFIIGLQPCPVTLTPNSELLELVLVTERTSNVTVVGGHFNGEHEIVSAILFDDGNIDLREYVMMRAWQLTNLMIIA